MNKRKTYSEILAEVRSEVQELTPSQVSELLAERDDVVLLDVREREEVDLGRIRGAVCIPRGFLEMRVEQTLPDRRAPIVVYCAGGIRSAFAARVLGEMGYDSVYSMRGGFTAWKDDGRPFDQESRLSPEQARRYSRQLLLKEVGAAGQRKLLESRVLIVGAGGLGSPAALYLAAAGVGTLGIADADVVDLSNLHRQILHTTASVGRRKVESAAETLRGVNPDSQVVMIPERLTSQNAMEIIAGYDVVLDGSDNFATKYLVNDACYFARKPNIYGSVFQFEGQAAVFDPARGGPCYRCLFPEPPPPGLAPNCDEAGVLGALPGTIGLIQALETMKVLLGIGEPLRGRLLLFDAHDSSFRTLTVHSDPRCRLCGRQTIKDLIDYGEFCGGHREDYVRRDNPRSDRQPAAQEVDEKPRPAQGAVG